MASGEFVPRTTAHVSADIEGIAVWIAAVKGVLDRFDQGLSVSVGRWEPGPPVSPPPVAVPKCFWARAAPESPTSIADLARTLELVRNWADALHETLDDLPDTPIPPPQP